MSILDKIVSNKRNEVELSKELYPTKLLERNIYYQTPCVSLKKYLLRPDKVGIIAEIKRKSPSKGVINPAISVEQLSIGYMQAGASAISVLTDQKFFGGSNEDLTTARRFNFCPILRKDFILDRYQIVEAKSLGADAILLIAQILSKAEVLDLAEHAKSLGLEVLFEIHSEQDLEKWDPIIEMIGVNNRDLKDFSVSLHKSVELGRKIPSGVVKVAESGINSVEDMQLLIDHGYNGVLIGERFMRHARPDESCQAFIKALRALREKREN